MGHIPDDEVMKMKKLYKTLMVNSCLINLCDTKMAINSRSKRVYLLCPNSIKSCKSETKKIMQKYTN